MTVGIIVAIVIIATAAAVVARRRNAATPAAELKQLDLNTLNAADRDDHLEGWMHIQGSFVDAPAVSLESADNLVSHLVQHRLPHGRRPAPGVPALGPLPRGRAGVR